jgi:hypothetical protein
MVGGKARRGEDPVKIITTQDPVQRAAAAASPLFHHIASQLHLGPDEAERLMLRIADLYLQGRTAGAAEFAHQMNLTLADDDIAVAFRITDGPEHPGLN